MAKQVQIEALRRALEDAIALGDAPLAADIKTALRRLRARKAS